MIQVIAYDEAWQYPAITEKQAFNCISRLCKPKGAKRISSQRLIYLGFPWATLIDSLRKNGQQAIFLKGKLMEISSLIGEMKNDGDHVYTTCQHIHAYQHQSLFRESGVTDIFWSHSGQAKSFNQTFYDNFKIHPFPLYPVQATTPIPLPRIGVEPDRKFLFSFKGAESNQWYISDARSLIGKYLSADPLGSVIMNDKWHYQKTVYEDQIDKSLYNDDQNHDPNYTSMLTSSTFSLCPVGTGPNTIRLWESLNTLSIPVIIGKYLDLPCIKSTRWDDAVIQIEDNPVDVMRLPTTLRNISAEEINERVFHCSLIAQELKPSHYGRYIAEKILEGLVIHE